jgi:hypothetical protein
MRPYKLKELRQTKQHEEAIIRHVKQNLSQKRPKRRILAPLLAAVVTTAVLLFVFFQYSGGTDREQNAAGYTILQVFDQVDGDGAAYSELFKEFDHQNSRQLNYFKPVPLTEFINANDAIIPDIIEPFDQSNAEVLAVNDGMQTELQFSFRNGEEFMVISVAKHFMNSLYPDFLEDLTEDAAGNRVEQESLDETTPLIHQIRTKNSAMTYRYFTFDDEKNKMNITQTTANELYTYYNGAIYHVGYNVEGNPEEVVSYVKEFILQNNLQEVGLEHNLMGDKEHARGGKSRLIGAAILLAGVIFAAILSRRVRMKTKRIIWGLTTMFVIAPLLSWLIGMSYGIYEGSGFAAAAVMMILFPILFLTGLVILLIGIFKKEAS